MESFASLVLLFISGGFLCVCPEACADQRAESHNDGIKQGKSHDADEDLGASHSRGKQEAGVKGKQKNAVMKENAKHGVKLLKAKQLPCHRCQNREDEKEENLICGEKSFAIADIDDHYH